MPKCTVKQHFFPKRSGITGLGFCIYSKRWENQGLVSTFFQKDGKTRARFLLYFKKMKKTVLGFCFISKRWENQGPVSALFQKDGNLHCQRSFFSKRCRIAPCNSASFTEDAEMCPAITFFF